jgi:hypothetical protein
MAQKMRLVPEGLYNKFMSQKDQDEDYSTRLKNQIKKTFSRRNIPPEIKARLIQQNRRYLYNKRMADADIPLLVKDVGFKSLIDAFKREDEDVTDADDDADALADAQENDADALGPIADAPGDALGPVAGARADALEDAADADSDADIPMSEDEWVEPQIRKQPRKSPLIENKKKKRYKRPKQPKPGDKRTLFYEPQSEIPEKKPRKKATARLNVARPRPSTSETVAGRKRTKLNTPSSKIPAKVVKWTSSDGTKRPQTYAPNDKIPDKRQKLDKKLDKKPTRKSARLTTKWTQPKS